MPRRRLTSRKRNNISPLHPPTAPPATAGDYTRRYAVPLDQYCAIRMQELGIPEDKQGADDLRPYMQWCAFDPHGRDGGHITSGITVNSGVFNPELLKGQKG